MKEIVASVPLSEEVRAALVEREGPMGRLLCNVLHYERCEWDQIVCQAATPAQFRAAYLEAIEWSTTLVDASRQVV